MNFATAKATTMITAELKIVGNIEDSERGTAIEEMRMPKAVIRDSRKSTKYSKKDST